MRVDPLVLSSSIKNNGFYQRGKCNAKAEDLVQMNFLNAINGSGVTEVLKQKFPRIKVFAVELEGAGAKFSTYPFRPDY